MEGQRGQAAAGARAGNRLDVWVSGRREQYDPQIGKLRVRQVLNPVDPRCGLGVRVWALRGPGG